MSRLESLLHPVSLETFEEQFYEQKHLRIATDDPERFRSVLSFEQLDEILGTYGIAAPDINLVNYERHIRPEEYTWKKGMADPARVARLFAEGATIVFNSLQDRFKPLNDLCAELSAESGLRTQANVYLTPPESQGFAAHWDTHDVLILQVEGEKRWQIFNEYFPYPAESEKYKFQRGDFEPGEPAEEFTLRPGEVLYIPRGVMHSASSSADKTLHVTLGIIPYTWEDLLREAVEHVAEKNPELRGSVPVRPDDASRIHGELQQRLRAMLGEEEVRELLEHRKSQSLHAFRPCKTDFLAQSLSASDVSEHDVVSPYPHLSVSMQEAGDSDRILFTAEGLEISFPAAAQGTLKQLFGSGKPLAVEDFDDDITLGSRKVVISRLIKEGLVFKQKTDWRENHERQD